MEIKRSHLYRRSVLTLVILAALGAGSGLCAQDRDDDVITVNSTIVLLNATVTNSAGTSVTGLSRSQFTVFEDGVEQNILTFENESTPFAAVILLDTSGSMEQRLSIARSAAIEFLYGLRRDDNAAIYRFDSKVSLVQDFSNSRDIVESIFDLKADGMTSLNDAIYKAAALLSSRTEKRRAIIVLSDGADNSSGKSSDAALKAAIAANATIYTIDMSSPDERGVERVQNQGVLKSLAGKSGGTFVATPGGPAMRNSFKSIVEELSSQYTVTYEPTNLKKDGKFRSIEVRIKKPGLAIRTRKGYNAPKGK